MNCTTAPCMLQYLKPRHQISMTMVRSLQGNLGSTGLLGRGTSPTKGTLEVELNASYQELENQRVVGLRRKLVGGYSRCPVCGLWGKEKSICFSLNLTSVPSRWAT